MMLTRLLPAPQEQLDLDDPASRATLLEWYAAPSAKWLRTNLVTSVSGSAGGADGTSKTLTNASDRRVLGVIRELSDLVLVGARSVRTEGYLMPRRSSLAVVTSTGDLSGHALRDEDLPRVVIACPASAEEKVRETLGDVQILSLGQERATAGELIDGLRDLGYESIVCEGGPALAGQLVAAALVDEICLTTSPVANGGALPPFGPQGFDPVTLEPSQVMTDGAGYLFVCWTVRA